MARLARKGAVLMRDRWWRGIVLGVLAWACWANAAAAATGPAVVGSISNATSLSGALAVAVSGNDAYEVSYWSGQLNAIDISNPAAPTIIGSTPSTVSMTAATNVTISGNYAFVTSKNRNASTSSNDDGSGNSLTIVDISDPTNPTVVGTLQDPANLFGAYSVAVSGNYAYVASQGVLQGEPQSPRTSTGSFSVIDITSPSGPTLVGHIDNASLTGSLADALDHATAVAITNHVAFVTAFYSSRLTAIDISNPSAPAVVSSLHDPTNLAAPNDVAVVGGYAYVVNETATAPELTIVNISNPAAPPIAGTISDPRLALAYRIRARGNFVYIAATGAATVAAVDVSNPTAPRLAGVVTDSTHLANVTGIDLSSSGRYIVATAPHLASETRPLFPPFPLQAGGPTATGTVSVIDLDPTPISVTIAPSSEPAGTTTNTSASFSFAASDDVAAVQCSLDHAAFAACTSPTTASYTSLKPGTHTFTVQATDATGTTAQASYTWTVTAPPRASAAPKISGTAQQGKRLSAATGAWSGNPAPSFSYQWQRCNAKGQSCKSISRQTKTTYRLTAADVGSRLEVAVTGRNSIGAAIALSPATRVVKWASGSFASAALVHSGSSTPGLSLSVPSPGSGLLLQRLAFSLPKGLSLSAGQSALVSGLVVKSRAGKRLTFKLSLKHGTLTLSLTKSTAGVTLALARGLLAKVKLTGKSPKLSVSLYYKGKPVRRGAVKLRLA